MEHFLQVLKKDSLQWLKYEVSKKDFLMQTSLLLLEEQKCSTNLAKSVSPIFFFPLGFQVFLQF